MCLIQNEGMVCASHRFGLWCHWLLKAIVLVARVSKPVVGRMLTSAPVSTRNCCFNVMFERIRRSLLWLAIDATSSKWPRHFPTKYRAADTFELLLHECGGNSTVGCLGGKKKF